MSQKYHCVVFCFRASVAQMVTTAVNMDTPAAAPPCPAKNPSDHRTEPQTLPFQYCPLHGSFYDQIYYVYHITIVPIKNLGLKFHNLFFFNLEF